MSTSLNRHKKCPFAMGKNNVISVEQQRKYRYVFFTNESTLTFVSDSGKELFYNRDRVIYFYLYKK